MIDHVSQKQHNPQPDDMYAAKSEYSEVVIRKEECSKTKEDEANKEKVAPRSGVCIHVQTEVVFTVIS